MRVEESIRMAAPRERVWRYVSEPTRYSEFMVGSSWEPIEGEPSSGLRARVWLNVEVGSTDLGGAVELPGGVLALIASRLSAPMMRRDVRNSLAALQGLLEKGGR